MACPSVLQTISYWHLSFFLVFLGDFESNVYLFLSKTLSITKINIRIKCYRFYFIFFQIIIDLITIQQNKDINFAY